MRELTRIREQRGWSQQRLADESRVNKATINQIERGRRSPNVETLQKLAEALDVEVSDFFPKVQASLFDEDERRRSWDVAQSSNVRILEAWTAYMRERVRSWERKLVAYRGLRMLDGLPEEALLWAGRWGEEVREEARAIFAAVECMKLWEGGSPVALLSDQLDAIREVDVASRRVHRWVLDALMSAGIPPHHFPGGPPPHYGLLSYEEAAELAVEAAKKAAKPYEEAIAA